jgi:tRNA threonylcarbamoyladenosine biosynthesis protein TsaE
MPEAIELALTDESATLALGAALAPLLGPGMVVFLHGDLGAGKTTLVRGLLRALGVTGAVKSPTYTLVEPYRLAGFPVHHFDLYRLRDPMELEEMGIRDYLSGDALCMVEWPERGAPVLVTRDLDVFLATSPDGEGRIVRVTATSPRGDAVVRGLTSR